MTLAQITAEVTRLCASTPQFFPLSGRTVKAVGNTNYLSGSPLPALSGVYGAKQLYLVMDDRNRVEPVSGPGFCLSWYLRRAKDTPPRHEPTSEEWLQLLRENNLLKN